MSKNLKNCFEQFKFIAKIKDKSLQKKLLKDIANDNTFRALKEIAINYNSGNIKSDKKIKKYSKFLKKFAKKSNSKLNKRKLVIQSGGFLQLALPVIATLLSEILT